MFKKKNLEPAFNRCGICGAAITEGHKNELDGIKVAPIKIVNKEKVVFHGLEFGTILCRGCYKSFRRYMYYHGSMRRIKRLFHIKSEKGELENGKSNQD